MNFWQRLTKPFLALAPMEDVTDVVFREVVATLLPHPDVFFTEFVSADGLCSKGYTKTVEKFKYTSNQRPIVAQIWGKNPENLHKAAQIVEELKFDGVDINMGCPDKAVMKQGAGASLCLNPSLAKEIIDSVKKGAPNLPISVKTRLGAEKITTEEWISFLLEQKLDALTVHGRSAKQMSDVPANWEEIGKAVALKDKISPETILIGNGDIASYENALEMHKGYGVDGIMIARGIFNNPWVFSPNALEHTKEENFSLLLKHVSLYIETWGNSKNFAVMKKFFKMYIKGFEGASELRMKLMECKNASQVRKILE